MKKIFILSALVLLTACQRSPNLPSKPTTLPAETAEEVSSIDLALIALGDGTIVSGPQFIGCGDTIQLVESSSLKHKTTDEELIQAALGALFQVESSTYGESGLYNALYQSELSVNSVTLSDDKKTVMVALTGTIASGGICDDPRIEAQILETIKANSPEEANVSVTIDGKDLHEYFDMSGGQE